MRFPFSDHHRRLQMYVDNHEQFMITGLEEKVLDIAEKDVCNLVKLGRVGEEGARRNSPIFWDPIGDWYRSPF